MIIALAGRRIDARDANTRSFPLENAPRVRSELRKLFETLQPTAIVSSAACGADLIALEEADALGIRRRVILPFDPARFLNTSVTDRPGDWQSTYERVIRDVSATSDLVVLSIEMNDDESYLVANSAILDEAARIAKSSGDEPGAVLVWDGPRGNGDLTDAFRLEAERRGWPVMTVPTD